MSADDTDNRVKTATSNADCSIVGHSLSSGSVRPGKGGRAGLPGSHRFLTKLVGTAIITTLQRDNGA